MMKYFAAVSAVVMFFLPSVCQSYRWHGRPGCPLYHPDKVHTWAGFMQNQYGDGLVGFSVRIDRPLPGLAPGCYTMWYKGGGNWGVTSSNPPWSMISSGADPNKLQMNILGNALKFNEDGYVMDNRSNVVGALRCDLGSEC
jgi:hypothetical protein